MSQRFQSTIVHRKKKNRQIGKRRGYGRSVAMTPNLEKGTKRSKESRHKRQTETQPSTTPMVRMTREVYHRVDSSLSPARRISQRPEGNAPWRAAALKRSTNTQMNIIYVRGGAREALISLRLRNVRLPGSMISQKAGDRRRVR